MSEEIARVAPAVSDEPTIRHNTTYLDKVIGRLSELAATREQLALLRELNTELERNQNLGAPSPKKMKSVTTNFFGRGDTTQQNRGVRAPASADVALLEEKIDVLTAKIANQVEPASKKKSRVAHSFTQNSPTKADNLNIKDPQIFVNLLIIIYVICLGAIAVSLTYALLFT
jgi:hypothetical protein